MISFGFVFSSFVPVTLSAQHDSIDSDLCTILSAQHDSIDGDLCTIMSDQKMQYCTLGDEQLLGKAIRMLVISSL